MSDAADLPFAQSPRGLFSPQEMRQLMRAELARAKRYGFPLSCLLVGIDRLEALHDLYGVESKVEIFRTVLDFLRRRSRAADVVASLSGDRLLLLVPYVERKGALSLAERMREGARALDFASDSRNLQVTLSIGVAHARTREPEAYDALFRSADDCQRMASSGGGDRVIEVDVLDAARDRPAGDRRSTDSPDRAEGERRQRAELLASDEAAGDAGAADSTAAGGPSPANPLAGLRPNDLMEVVREALGQLGLDPNALSGAGGGASPPSPPAPEPAPPQQPLAAPAGGGPSPGRGSDDLELQERRIAKLSDAVQSLQQQLANLADGGSAGRDGGVASMGKVFGALDDATGGDADRRKELMGALFKANLALQQRRADSEGSD